MNETFVLHRSSFNMTKRQIIYLDTKTYFAHRSTTGILSPLAHWRGGGGEALGVVFLPLAFQQQVQSKEENHTDGNDYDGGC